MAARTEPGAPSLDLTARVVMVTGASEGIGRTLAVAFATAGARVIVVARRANKLAEVRAEIERRGGQVETVTADVTVEDDRRKLARVTSAFARPDERLVLVNNAGLGFTKAALDTDESEWDRLFDVHAKATFFCCRAIAPLMIERGYGKIINMSSTWAASTDDGKAAYSAAKGAVSRITAALSTEWAPHGIRVNALAPTTTSTDFTMNALKQRPDRVERLLRRIKLGRFATPEDIIGPALFLAGSASDFVTGQILFVDGGWNAGG